MKDKLEAGMYLRTDTGQIAKNYGEFYEPSVNVGLGIMEEINGVWLDNKCINYTDKKYIVKASYNIIDLIEVGDYVNGYLVIDNNMIDNFNKKYVQCGHIANNEYKDEWVDMTFYSKDIKSIVTKEQFESYSYKVGE